MKSRCYRHGCRRASHRALRPGLLQLPVQLSQRSSSFLTRCCIQLRTSSTCRINPGRALRCTTVFFPVRHKNNHRVFSFSWVWKHGGLKNNEALTGLCHRFHIPNYFTSFLICEATEGKSCPSRLLAVTDHDKLICVSVDYHRGRCFAAGAFIYLPHAYVVLLYGAEI